MNHFPCHTTIFNTIQREKSSTWRGHLLQGVPRTPGVGVPSPMCLGWSISHPVWHFWRCFSFFQRWDMLVPCRASHEKKNIYTIYKLIEMLFVDRMFLWLLAKLRTLFCFGKEVEKNYLLSFRSTNMFNVKYPCVVHSTNLDICEFSDDWWELQDCLGRAPY